MWSGRCNRALRGGEANASGIMGASRDLLPLIGEVPGSEGLYAAVAFNGMSILGNLVPS